MVCLYLSIFVLETHPMNPDGPTGNVDSSYPVDPPPAGHSPAPPYDAAVTPQYQPYPDQPQKV